MIQRLRNVVRKQQGAGGSVLAFSLFVTVVTATLLLCFASGANPPEDVMIVAEAADLQNLFPVSEPSLPAAQQRFNAAFINFQTETQPDKKEAEQPAKKEAEPKVTPIPEEIIARFKLDTTFYKKHLDYKGFSILSSAKVSDAGLLEARYLIDKLLHERDDILKAMIKKGARFMVMAPTEMTTDVPEQRRLKNDPKTNWDQRARGLGGNLSSCGEENLLNLKGDRYKQENILIHEFNHGIHSQGLKAVDPTFDPRLRDAYNKAKAAGLWKGTYLMENPAEYWAEACQAYFDTMRPAYAPKRTAVNTHVQLKEYDPALYKLVDEVYKGTKWRYVRYDVRNPPGGKKEPDVKK